MAAGHYNALEITHTEIKVSIDNRTALPGNILTTYYQNVNGMKTAGSESQPLNTTPEMKAEL